LRRVITPAGDARRVPLLALAGLETRRWSKGCWTLTLYGAIKAFAT
jgi:hypothetical protein